MRPGVSQPGARGLRQAISILATTRKTNMAMSKKKKKRGFIPLRCKREQRNKREVDRQSTEDEPTKRDTVDSRQKAK